MSPVVLALACVLISIPLALFVVPRDSLGGDEPSFEGFANLFPSMRSSAGVVGVVVYFLILAFLRALLGLLFSAAIYIILVRILVQPTNTYVYTTLCAISYTSVVELLTRIPR